MISDFKDGERLIADLLVVDCKKGVTSTQKAYLTLVFQDASGIIEGKKWDFDPDDEALFVKGQIVSVQFDVLKYREALQLKVLTGRKVSQQGLDWSRFIPNAPVGLDAMRAKLQAYVDSFTNKDVKDLVNGLLRRFGEKYFQWPAAVRNHHNYVSGLLYHSLTMADMALKVAEVYPSLDRDILIGGTIIHDLGKTIELSGPNVTQYTLEGKLLGHISIGHAECREVAKELGFYAYDDLPESEKTPSHPLYRKKEIAVVFEHIVLSHHGKQEFGSPVLPLTREAFVIALIDDLDAKMAILDKAYEGLEKGTFTARLPNMDDRYFYYPLYSKENTPPSGLPLEKEKEDLA